MIDTAKTGQKCYEVIRPLFKTQKQVAEALGISYATVSNWKSGLSMPSIDNIVIIAEMTGSTLDELVIRC